MGSPYKHYKTNPEQEQTGITLDYGDFKIKIARAGGANKRYQKAVERKTRPHRKAIASDTFDNDRSMAILREVYAETVVLGWEDVQDAEGKDIPFSKENVIKLFTDLPDLFNDVMQQATNMALFRESILEEDAKN